MSEGLRRDVMVCWSEPMGVLPNKIWMVRQNDLNMGIYTVVDFVPGAKMFWVETA